MGCGLTVGACRGAQEGPARRRERGSEPARPAQLDGLSRDVRMPVDHRVIRSPSTPGSRPVRWRLPSSAPSWEPPARCPWRCRHPDAVPEGQPAGTGTGRAGAASPRRHHRAGQVARPSSSSPATTLLERFVVLSLSRPSPAQRATTLRAEAPGTAPVGESGSRRLNVAMHGRAVILAHCHAAARLLLRRRPWAETARCSCRASPTAAR